MTCSQIEPQLNALADRALVPWQAWRVQRHLAACPACAAHLADIQRLDTAVLDWQDAPMPSDLSTRIAALLPVLPSAPRRALSARPAAVGLAGLAAALAAFFWFLPGQPGQPTIAYADVVKTMHRVKTISFRTYEYNSADNLSAALSSASREWDRRSPPAIAQSNVGTIDPEIGSASIVDIQGKFVRTPQGTYLFHPSDKHDIDDLQSDIENDFEGFTEQPMPRHFDHGYVYNMIRNPKQSVTLLNGKRCVLFTFDDVIIWRPSKSTPGVHDHSRCSIWVDPSTCLAIRKETRFWIDTTPGQYADVPRTVVNDDFHYNQVSPPGVFNWPPKGAKVTKF